jgi:glycosyltransferase involved in cell wall biosynthesis
MSSSIDLSIVVPAYKEERSIEEALSRLHNEISKTGLNFEIILVVDGLVDRTEEIANSLNLVNLKIISYEQNQGKGYALRTGTREISGSVTAFFDGDLDIDASCLLGLYRQLQECDADVVVGSKVHHDSVVSYPPFRRFQSQIMRFLVWTLFSLNIGDTQTGIKVFRTERLQEAINMVHTTGFCFDVDLLVRMHDQGCRIMEGPVVLNYQFASTTSLKSSLVVLFDLLSLKLKRLRRQGRHL